MELHVVSYLVVSAIMLFAGIYGFFTRKNLLAVLISVELMLNATNINFALFGIGIAAAETAVAIAIIINIYRNIRNIQTDNIDELKG